MKKIKKGQIAGQVFIYMMAIIVIGAIALIGYQAIDKIVKKSCEAERATFKIDLERDIEANSPYGKVTPVRLDVPCGYNTICFVDASQIGNAAFECPENTIIRDSVRNGNGYQQNIFVVSDEQTTQLGYNELISLSSTTPPKCLCIPQRNNKFYITFRGRGSSTEIGAS